MQIELDATATDEIRKLASALHKTPEEAFEDVLANGIHTMQRFAFYTKNRGTVSAERGLEILRKAGVGNPPDPGDELPDDLKYLLDERR